MNIISLTKIYEYLKRNLHRILLIAVILTFFLAMRYAAIGKYVSYIENATQVTSSDFCFESESLAAVDSGENLKENNVGDWEVDTENGIATKTISFDIKNYDNAARYNAEGIYYYVIADIISGEGQGTSIQAISYVNDSGDDTEYTYDGHKLGFIKGGEPLAQTVKIELNFSYTDYPQKTTVSVAAICLPSNAMKSISPAATFYSGSYSAEIEGLFKIGGSSEKEIKVTAELRQIQSGDTSVGYELVIYGSELNKAGNAQIAVFYKSKIIYPSEDQNKDTTIAAIDSFTEELGYTFQNGWKPDSEIDDHYDYYYTTVVNSGGMVSRNFRVDQLNQSLDGAIAIAVYIEPDKDTSPTAITLNRNLKLAKLKK